MADGIRGEGVGWMPTLPSSPRTGLPLESKCCACRRSYVWKRMREEAVRYVCTTRTNVRVPSDSAFDAEDSRCLVDNVFLYIFPFPSSRYRSAIGGRLRSNENERKIFAIDEWVWRPFEGTRACVFLRYRSTNSAINYNVIA